MTSVASGYLSVRRNRICGFTGTTAYPLSSWTPICFDVTAVADNFCVWLLYVVPTSFESLRSHGPSSQKGSRICRSPPGGHGSTGARRDFFGGVSHHQLGETRVCGVVGSDLHPIARRAAVRLARPLRRWLLCRGRMRRSVDQSNTRWKGHAMDVQFITSVAVITPDPAVGRRLYVDALGLPLTPEADGYLHSEDIDGCKSFGVWPLTQAALACFGTPDWPVERPVPQASVEFEVADADTVQVAADELKEKGFTLLHDAHTEPWGQTVARLQSLEGTIIGISYAPTMHP
jgi:catechol 2,3-dioxygenase-like lactoylglutathione lyase family enzyme